MWSPIFYVQAVWLALGQIWANKSRSCLTALGIIIGVASVTGVIAALSGLRTKVLSEFESIGASKIVIFPNRPEDAPRNLYPIEKIRLKPSELNQIAEHCPSIRTLTPEASIGVEVRCGDISLSGVTARAIFPSWHEIERRSVLVGRPFVEIDETNTRSVCLVNDKAVEELHLKRDPTGQEILLNNRRFLIVGVVETLQTSMFNFGQNASSTEVFVPFSTAEKIQDSALFFHIIGLLQSPDLADEAKAEVRFVMRKARGLKPDEPETFQVEAIDQFIAQFNSLSIGITAIAGGIVGISLLVGGVGIMNIMLVSVSERTREIGLRKAVGATPAAILMQFLLEAVTLCLVGGFIGVALGQLFAFGLTQIPNAQMEKAEVPMWAIVMSFAFSAGVGLIFGMFPAIKAARLDPIEALRHE
jgi:putative ABC transport system permease protein